MKWESEGLYIPMSCQQCQDAPCMIICPVKAISRDEKYSRVMVDQTKCIGKFLSAISVMGIRNVFASVI
jgi:Fe-S-cluster-containing hydrogenase component 2